ncbi:MAG: 5-methyltetrahydrofolate--homocysteine methyltransferase [Bacteroidaceae bacterium]|nr:5-methyltetrahydrofolate--homocysteine methyltransferase [Bacteroidaceae bacterium]
MHHRYRISDIIDYINWLYFFHAWGLPMKFASIAKVHACDACRASWVASFPLEEQVKAKEAARLYVDAQRQLSRLTPYTTIHAKVELFDANAQGDDIVILFNKDDKEEQFLLPMLRQQQPDADGFCLCLADFLRPIEQGKADRFGVFATSVSSMPATGDDYASLLTQTLCDRLAEAAAERLHQQVRTELWGYAPEEQLTMEELHQEKFQGIRPAVGYPSLPDISINFLIDRLISFESIGVTLTEHGMMRPHASVSGLMFAHPQAHYFSIGEISEEQLQDYAQRRNLPADELRKYLS